MTRVAADVAQGGRRALEVTVERAVYRGQGLARHDGQVVFVPRGLPGDRLRVRVVSVTPGYVKAEIEQVLAPGAGRVESRCPHFADCGGCAYQHLDPGAQAALKEAVLLDSLRARARPGTRRSRSARRRRRDGGRAPRSTSSTQRAACAWASTGKAATRWWTSSAVCSSRRR